MAFSLSFTNIQSNDATYITIADAVGEYDATSNPDGWEGGANPNYSTIATDQLTLEINVLDKDGNNTIYDTIDLYDLDSTGPFASAAELTWTIDAADLVSGGTAMGTSSDLLTDGVYTMTYTLTGGYTTTYYVLIDGGVTIDVYDALREIENNYDNEINDESDEIMQTLLKYSYLLSIQRADTTSDQTKIANMLWTLDKMLSDSSKYSW